ncbi:MAG TPA: hypothetical protein VE404_01615 [Verrucomicrobiae bacterium]|nr:hypothetical protein [Verrucomicrobiae bacterium]
MLECEEGCSSACSISEQESRCESICLVPCQEKDPNPIPRPGLKAHPGKPDEDPNAASDGGAARDDSANSRGDDEVGGDDAERENDTDPNSAAAEPADPNAVELCLDGCVLPCMADASWRLKVDKGHMTDEEKAALHSQSPWDRWLRLVNDGRQRLEAAGHLGTAIDSFAAGEFNKYVNPEVSGDVKLRGIAGAELAYRAHGNLNSGNQVWLYGKAIYGVRSSERTCIADPNSPPSHPECDPNATSGKIAADIIRNATSLEAYGGVRWEFLALQRKWSAAASNLYVKAQMGFLTVAGSGGDVVDVRSYDLGVITTNGRFQGSYAEVGGGRTDLFLDHANRRFKVNGYLTWRALTSPWRRPLAQPFFQMSFDGDLGRGSDTVQTYIGVAFDLDGFDALQTFKLGGS